MNDQNFVVQRYKTNAEIGKNYQINNRSWEEGRWEPEETRSKRQQKEGLEPRVDLDSIFKRLFFIY